jgi:hypothetical protein
VDRLAPLGKNRGLCIEVARLLMLGEQPQCHLCQPAARRSARATSTSPDLTHAAWVLVHVDGPGLGDLSVSIRIGPWRRAVAAVWTR